MCSDALPRLGQNHYQNMDTNAFNPLRQKASQGMSTDGRTPKPASQWSAGEAGERGTLVGKCARRLMCTQTVLMTLYTGSEDTQHYQSKHVQALSSHTFMNMRTDAAKVPRIFLRFSSCTLSGFQLSNFCVSREFQQKAIEKWVVTMLESCRNGLISLSWIHRSSRPSALLQCKTLCTLQTAALVRMHHLLFLLLNEVAAARVRAHSHIYV